MQAYLSKLVQVSCGFLRRSETQISLLTSGVAVAVSAIKGTCKKRDNNTHANKYQPIKSRASTEQAARGENVLFLDGGP